MKRLAMTALLAVSATAQADISYDYIEAGITRGSIDAAGGDIDQDGWLVGGSFSAAKPLAIRPYVAGSTAEILGFDVDSFSVGADLIFHHQMAAGLDGLVFAGAADVEYDIDALGISDSDTGTRGGLGVRYAASDVVELSAAAYAQNSFDAGDNVLQVGMQGNLSPKVSVGLSYSTMEDISEVTGYARLNF